jgi:hypothetical protein
MFSIVIFIKDVIKTVRGRRNELRDNVVWSENMIQLSRITFSLFIASSFSKEDHDHSI